MCPEKRQWEERKKIYLLGSAILANLSLFCSSRLRFYDHHTEFLNHLFFHPIFQSLRSNMDIVFNQHPNGTFDIEYFQYTPSKEAGLAFVVIFAGAGIVHVGYMFFFRAWSFIPMILGGICKLA